MVVVAALAAVASAVVVMFLHGSTMKVTKELELSDVVIRSRSTGLASTVLEAFESPTKRITLPYGYGDPVGAALAGDGDPLTPSELEVTPKNAGDSLPPSALRVDVPPGRRCDEVTVTRTPGLDGAPGLALGAAGECELEVRLEFTRPTPVKVTRRPLGKHALAPVTVEVEVTKLDARPLRPGGVPLELVPTTLSSHTAIPALALSGMAETAGYLFEDLSGSDLERGKYLRGQRVALEGDIDVSDIGLTASGLRLSLVADADSVRFEGRDVLRDLWQRRPPIRSWYALIISGAGLFMTFLSGFWKLYELVR
jgi:hypothetical protein